MTLISHISVSMLIKLGNPEQIFVCTTGSIGCIPPDDRLLRNKLVIENYYHIISFLACLTNIKNIYFLRLENFKRLKL